MKKLYILSAAFIFTLISTTLNASTINVSITNNAFTPSTFSANVGDVIVWTWNSSGVTHNVTSIASGIPAGAAALASGNMSSGTYSYTITISGNYAYSCTIHQLAGMVGGFTVSAVGVAEPATDLITNFYPNPFKEKVTIKYDGIETIDIFNIVGERIRTIELPLNDNKIEVDFSAFPSGMYFYRTYKEDDILVETRKVIKLR